jgi:hypothetical protein
MQTKTMFFILWTKFIRNTRAILLMVGLNVRSGDGVTVEIESSTGQYQWRIEC